MNRYKTPVYLSLLAALTASPTVVLADDVNCPPNLGSVTVDGNVLVAAPCRLDGTTVKGNVHLYAGGSLVARGNVRIEGSIQAENSDFIDVADTFVNGNIQLDNLVGDRSIIQRSTVGGSIQLSSNRSRLEVLNNTVDSDVQAFANRGGVVIADNVIDGNLQCKENNPAPAGGNNRVQGNKEDQCANLVPETGTSPAPAPAPAPTPAPTPPVSADNSSSSSGGGGSLSLGRSAGRRSCATSAVTNGGPSESGRTSGWGGSTSGPDGPSESRGRVSVGMASRRGALSGSRGLVAASGLAAGGTSILDRPMPQPKLASASNARALRIIVLFHPLPGPCTTFLFHERAHASLLRLLR